IMPDAPFTTVGPQRTQACSLQRPGHGTAPLEGRPNFTTGRLRWYHVWCVAGLTARRVAAAWTSRSGSDGGVTMTGYLPRSTGRPGVRTEPRVPCFSHRSGRSLRVRRACRAPSGPARTADDRTRETRRAALREGLWVHHPRAVGDGRPSSLPRRVV